MCGIVGYIGRKKAQPILLSGLKRLEYRGYDSAGITTISDKRQATLLREKGKVAELGVLLGSNVREDTVGIGHTRWATHGEPAVRNAHPHKAGDLYLVHNGIIENYQELKASLEKQGVKFHSDTDSEVLAQLINSFYEGDLLQAVTNALHEVIGAYGIAVVSEKNPEEIVVARKGSPLILGLGDGEVYIASDGAALVGHVNQVVYLNDGEIAVCTRDGIELSDLSHHTLSPKVEKFELDVQNIQKQGYDHFLLKEVMEQPDTVAATLRGRLLLDEKRVHLGGLNLDEATLRGVKNILIIGCGTAHYAGVMASYLLEKLLDDVTFNVVVASEFRYRKAHIPENTIALVVSQSGETADTLACLREVKDRGVPVLGIVNTVGSTIAREVDGGVYLHVGAEISVASTKAFTSQVVAMLMFGLRVAQLKGASPEDINQVIAELGQLPTEVKKALKTHKDIKKIAKDLSKKEHALYLGRDRLAPIAYEGALKLKEISYIHAEAYPAGELKHGPIALIDDRFFTVFLLLDDWLYDKSVSNLEEVRARGGYVVAVTDSKKKLNADIVLKTDTKLKWLAPMVINTMLQLLAYEIAVARGNDVDQPRNLAKSVTVE